MPRISQSFARAILAAAALLVFAPAPSRGQETQRQYLSGTDKDHTVPWDFFMTRGRNSGRWTTIPVPSQWELQGFGSYHYGSDTIPDERGLYRYRFRLPAAWKGKRVRLVFDGSMTDTEVKVNGKPAGPVHQGAFYRFRYDVTDLVTYGAENVLEATVSKHSANESVNRAERQADFWVFGGIFRPVFLEALPARFIDRVALDARADGAFRADVYLGGEASPGEVTAQVVTLAGRAVGAPFSARVAPGQAMVTLRGRVASPRPWSPESPERYRVRLSLREGGRAAHVVTETFGFRTVEVRPEDGIYVNGRKVRLKGVNRHTFWPDAGRTTSRAVSEMDVTLMKDMNMNAVRMSHYPPDEHFLEVADSLGLFVLDELAGWQKNYDTDVGEKLVREMVTRDVNHPSILFWDNGNEGGFNFDLDDDFALYDPQGRKVLHPWEVHDGVNTAHYRPVECCAGKVFNGREIIMPTEIIHGLYDGGHGAGLADYWRAIRENPRGGGLFLWALLDEAVKRVDLPRDTLDGNGNQGVDGIVGPYREKEASFFTIKKLWSPVQLELGEQDDLPASFDGRLRVQNEYFFTDLERVRFSWELVRFPAPGDTQAGHTVVARGVAPSPRVAPQMPGELDLRLPADWRRADALRLTATDPYGRELYGWSWMISSAAQIAARTVTAGSGRVTGQEVGDRVVVAGGGARASFDRRTGELVAVERDGKALSLRNGPRVVHGTGTLASLRHFAEGDAYVVEAAYTGDLKQVRWRMYPSGWLELRYTYGASGALDAIGVTFDYPEEQVTGLKWLGRGPYRVWKNRMDGVEYDVWRKPYNDAITGVTWNYPEFKGFHANLHWAVLETREMPLTIVSATEDVFLRVLTPRFPTKDDRQLNPGFATVDFPAGSLSFLHGIPPIGSKFTSAEAMTPSGAKNVAIRGGRAQPQYDYTDTLYFFFGTPP
jgi:hypothetical protein